MVDVDSMMSFKLLMSSLSWDSCKEWTKKNLQDFWRIVDDPSAELYYVMPDDIVYHISLKKDNSFELRCLSLGILGDKEEDQDWLLVDLSHDPAYFFMKVGEVIDTPNSMLLISGIFDTKFGKMLDSLLKTLN